VKFVLKQEQFIDMLEKMLVKDIYPSSVLSIKGKTIYSIQKEEHARAIRFVKFSESYFESIDESKEESIDLNIEKVLKVIKNIPATVSLTIQTKGEKLLISGEKPDGQVLDIKLTYNEPEGDVIKSLDDVNIKMKEGTPVVTEQQIPLDIQFTIKLEDFKEITSYASSLGTEFYRFFLENKKLGVRIGNLDATSDEVTYYPKATIKKGEGLDVVYTYGIAQIGETFEHDVMVCTKSNCPTWIYETIPKKYILGLYIPPFEEG